VRGHDEEGHDGEAYDEEAHDEERSASLIIPWGEVTLKIAQSRNRSLFINRSR
jgi:hypothetical protein